MERLHCFDQLVILATPAAENENSTTTNEQPQSSQPGCLVGSAGLANKQNKHVLVAPTFEGGPRLLKKKHPYTGYDVQCAKFIQTPKKKQLLAPLALAQRKWLF